MVSGGQEPRQKEIHRLLSQLTGVEDVRVHLDDTRDGEIRELDIVTHGATDARRLTRDIESALLSGLGIVVDHRSIRISPNGIIGGQDDPSDEKSVRSLRKTAWQDPPQPAAQAERRIRLLNVRCVPDGSLYVEVTVELEIEGQTFMGQIRDADTPHGRSLTAARATLRAVAPTLDSDTAFVLEGLEEFKVVDEEGMLAVLRARSGRERPYFHGSAIVRASKVEAAARAVLDGLNRFWTVKSSP